MTVSDPKLSVAIPARSTDHVERHARFERLGWSVTVGLDGSAELLREPVLLILGTAAWFPKLCRQIERLPTAARPLVAIWHAEPLPPPRVSGLPHPRLHLREMTKIALRDPRATDPYTNAHRLRRLHRHGLPDVLAVSTPERKDYLGELGIEAHWIPLGYQRRHGHDLGLERDIGVLFLGSGDVPRRKHAIRALRRNGIDVLELGGWGKARGLWGERRTEVLNRTRILLNFARQPAQLSGLRLIIGMANKALVVSEPIWKPDPFVPGTHFVQAPLAEMPDLIRHYLVHDEERRQIADEGYRFVTQELRWEDSVVRLAELIRQELSSRQGSR